MSTEVKSAELWSSEFKVEGMIEPEAAEGKEVES
jgi:hypothetical protein